jgi:hypothetical protein
VVNFVPLNVVKNVPSMVVRNVPVKNVPTYRKTGNFFQKKVPERKAAKHLQIQSQAALRFT